VNLQNNK